MDEYSRPATLEDLKTLILALNEQKADYFLIGGYALFAHGYHRATTDIDVLVPASAEAGQKVREALLVLPDQAAKDIDPAWFTEGENIRVADAIVVDVMLNACGETYETLRKYAEKVEIDGVPVNTINLEGLLLTKQTMRDKDVMDRIVLERALEAVHAQAASRVAPEPSQVQHQEFQAVLKIKLAVAEAGGPDLASTEALAILAAAREGRDTVLKRNTGEHFVVKASEVLACVGDRSPATPAQTGPQGPAAPPERGQR